MPSNAPQAPTNDEDAQAPHSASAQVRDVPAMTSPAAYNSQDKVMKVLARRLVDGGAPLTRARKSFVHEQGCRIQHQVEWADTVVLKERLAILEANGYKVQSAGQFKQFEMGPAAYLIEGTWQPTWEPEACLCNHAPHFNMVLEYMFENLECSPTRLKARNIDDHQCAKLQQGLDARAVP